MNQQLKKILKERGLSEKRIESELIKANIYIMKLQRASNVDLGMALKKFVTARR